MKATTYRFIGDEKEIYKTVQLDDKKVITQWIYNGKPKHSIEYMFNMRARIEGNCIEILEGDKEW